jgi:hypothetical protein
VSICCELGVNTLEAALGGWLESAPTQPARDRFGPVARFRDRVAIVIGAGAPADRSSTATQRDPTISRALDVQSVLE